MITLKEYRKRASLTQIELAELVGIRQATLSSLENGKSRPHKKTALAIAEVLGISVDELLASVARSHSKMIDSRSEMKVPNEKEWAFLYGLDHTARQKKCD